MAGLSKALKFVVTLPVALLGLFESVGTQASAELAAWSDARTRDTAEAYAEFVIQYPESEFAWSAYLSMSKVQDGPIADEAAVQIAFPVPFDGVKEKSEYRLVYT